MNFILAKGSFIDIKLTFKHVNLISREREKKFSLVCKFQMNNYYKMYGIRWKNHYQFEFSVVVAVVVYYDDLLRASA